MQNKKARPVSDPEKLILEEKLEADPRGFCHYYQDDAGVTYDVVRLWKWGKLISKFKIFADDFGQFLERQIAWSDGAPIDADLSGEHGERIREADLSYPILIRIVDDKMLMVDGYHRMMKAQQDDEPFVWAHDVSIVLQEVIVE